MSTPLFLGIDLGTSGCRAIAIDAGRAIVAEARVSLPAPRQQDNASEQDAELWWQAVLRVLDDLSARIHMRAVHTIAVDATSGSVLLCGADGSPLHPALMYNDSRAGEQAAQIRAIAPAEAAAATGAGSGLAKLLWLKEQAFARHARHFLHQADWITGRLGGEFGHSDFNNALKTGYDALSGGWPDWLDALEVPRSWLPRVHAPGTPLTRIDAALAERFGLPADCRLVAGTTDSSAAFLATGANATGEAVTVLGSTLVLKIIGEHPVTDTRYGIYSQPLPATGGRHADGPRWLCGGASNSGGAVLRQYFTDAQMARMQAQLEPGRPTGLDYYPLPRAGERFPVADPGLAPRLSPRPASDLRFFQGMLEGLARIEREGYRRLQQAGAPAPLRVYTTGGGSHNPAWRTIREQLLGVPVITASRTEAAYGAALLARQGASPLQKSTTGKTGS